MALMGSQASPNPYLLVISNPAEVASVGLLSVDADHVRGEGLGARVDRRPPPPRRRTLRLGAGELLPDRNRSPLPLPRLLDEVYISDHEVLEVRAHVVVQGQAGGRDCAAGRAGEPALAVHLEVLGQHVQPDEGLVADVARLVRGLWREVVTPLWSEIVVHCY